MRINSRDYSSGEALSDIRLVAFVKNVPDLDGTVIAAENDYSRFTAIPAAGRVPAGAYKQK